MWGGREKGMNSRRTHVPFDPYYFDKQARQSTTYSIAETFDYIYRTNHWSGADSISGEGASLDQTNVLKSQLPALLQALEIKTLLDVPCGDYSWMQTLDLPVKMYIGADIVASLVQENQARYGDLKRQFLHLDTTCDPLPPADLVLCRDCLVHFSFVDIQRTLANMKASGIPYLLTTTFPACSENEDIITGDWRVLNLERPPFNFPLPLRLINEDCTEGDGLFSDKSLGLWETGRIGCQTLVP